MEQWEDYLLGYYEEAEWLAAEYVPTLDEYMKNGITSIAQRILLLSGVLIMEGQLLSQEALEKVDYPGRRVLTELNSLISRLADDTKSYKAEKARGELVSSIECYMKEEEALNHIYGILEPALKSDHVPFPCKKMLFDETKVTMLFDETRVTMVIFKDGDGFGIFQIGSEGSHKRVSDRTTPTLTD